MSFTNVYEDKNRAESYSKLEFPGTYYLAYRDIPQIISKYVNGNKAIDFGCGTGRSTRFLKKYGFDSIGIDISYEMIKNAKDLDPGGTYYLIEGNDFSIFQNNKFDLILSIFTFDNIPNTDNRVKTLKKLSCLLTNNGIIIILASRPEIYINEWASFSTEQFPENKIAKSGEKVKIIMKDVDDKRPVEDLIWFDEDYKDLFIKAKLKLIELMTPLGNSNEPFDWINETITSPWIIYILQRLLK